MAPSLQTSLVALEFSRHFVNVMLNEIPEDQYCHQPFPGESRWWIMGHLPSIDAFLLQACGGPSDPQLEKMKPFFFMKSQVLPNLSDYPPIAEVRAWFDVPARTSWIGITR